MAVSIVNSLTIHHQPFFYSIASCSLFYFKCLHESTMCLDNDVMHIFVLAWQMLTCTNLAHIISFHCLSPVLALNLTKWTAAGVPTENILYLGGPNIASEIYNKEYANARICGSNKWRKPLAKFLRQPHFIVWDNSDLVTHEVMGGLKNVYAIGAGKCLCFSHIRYQLLPPFINIRCFSISLSIRI